MKPLGHKAYGSIPHLPGSRKGPAEMGLDEAQAQFWLTPPRGAVQVVLEKLDGANVAAARVGDAVLAISRSGHLCETSTYVQHQHFAAWVAHRQGDLLSILCDGERLCGEWLTVAHGTRMHCLEADPFRPFDIRTGREGRAPWSDVVSRVGGWLRLPRDMGSVSTVADAEALCAAADWPDYVDPVEGLVWRVERPGHIALAKYVRPAKVDGLYLGGADPVLNDGAWMAESWAQP